MNDAAASDAVAASESAGALLRSARQAQGLAVDSLAAQLKVSPTKIDALEADRYDELQGVAFARALAQAACRALKIDAAPVLARLPQIQAQRLVRHGLAEPFMERAQRNGSPHGPLSLALLLGAVVLLGAALLIWVATPDIDWRGMTEHVTSAVERAAEPLAPSAPPTAPAASMTPSLTAPAASSVTAPPAVTATPAGPQPSAATAASVAGLPAPAGIVAAAASLQADPMPLVIRATGASWVEVVDAGGQSLLSRTLVAGESVGLDGTPPLRVKIGNASQTELRFRGEPVDLAAATRENIARLELR